VPATSAVLLTADVAIEATMKVVITTPTAHTIKPWPVSLKITSSVCTVAHFVRSRPATYPPRLADTTWTTINQTMAPIPIAFADAPSFCHGEVEAKPRAVPSVTSIRPIAAATKAPPRMAPQDTPELKDSLRPTTSGRSADVTSRDASMLCTL